MGERELCKLEVIGSIPFSSTSLRLLRKLRLGRPGARLDAKQGKAAAPKPIWAKAGDAAPNITKLEAEERFSFFAFCLRTDIN